MKSWIRPGSRAALLFALVTLMAADKAVSASDEFFKAPNVVAISAKLVTSGQPSASALTKLASAGAACW